GGRRGREGGRVAARFHPRRGGGRGVLRAGGGDGPGRGADDGSGRPGDGRVRLRLRGAVPPRGRGGGHGRTARGTGRAGRLVGGGRRWRAVQRPRPHERAGHGGRGGETSGEVARGPGVLALRAGGRVHGGPGRGGPGRRTRLLDGGGNRRRRAGQDLPVPWRRRRARRGAGFG